MENISEVKKRSLSTISREAKIKRATGSLAAIEAKKRNDPLYKRMIFYKKKWQECKTQLMKKYANKVISRARR